MESGYGTIKVDLHDIGKNEELTLVERLVRDRIGSDFALYVLRPIMVLKSRQARIKGQVEIFLPLHSQYPG